MKNFAASCRANDKHKPQVFVCFNAFAIKFYL